MTKAYKKAIADARQMLSESLAQVAETITSSYPFHPKIRDLYARFRENPGCRRTRALIHRMRIVAGKARPGNVGPYNALR